MKKVLVTGGAGFIGSNTAEYYARKDDVEEVIVVDNLSRGDLLHKNLEDYKFNWNDLQKNEKITLYHNDVADFQFLKKIFTSKQIDVIIHTAAQTAVTTSITNPMPDFDNNILATFKLLEAVRQSKLDPVMIYCSTNKVYGDNVNKYDVIQKEQRYEFSKEHSNGIAEDFPIDLCEHTPYGASKLCSDIYFQEYGHLYGLKTGVFRMSCIYGPRQFGVEDQGWVAHFIISVLKNKKLNIYGDGKQVRDVLYVSDLINAYDLFVEKANTIGHNVFNMGGGVKNTLSLLELIDILEKETGKAIEYEMFDWRPSDQKVYISDIRKANKILGWTPKVSPEEGVKQLTNWVNANINLFP